jgi:hypothetical protein
MPEAPIASVIVDYPLTYGFCASGKKVPGNLHFIDALSPAMACATPFERVTANSEVSIPYFHVGDHTNSSES